MAGTVVICFTDIVGSTELLTRLGDDAFDDLRRRHFDALERQVDEHGGKVVKRLGDGLMLSFASASDAVAAGVAMQQAAASLSAPSDGTPGLRVGISAGDATQEDDGDWYGTPVVEGARLCDASGAGRILVSEVVRLLAGSRGGHEFRSVGPLELKGLPEPIGAAEVTWTPSPSGIAVPLPGALTPSDGELPFSGRDEPLNELRRHWKAAVAGDRRVVMVSGEPGIGKTRLIAELARAVHAEGALVLLGRTDEHVDAPYGPWREALRPLVRTVPEDHLERHVEDHGGELVRLAPDLARRIVDLPPPVSVDAETERLLLFDAVTGLIAASSTIQPVLLVLDDLHWADRSSLLLLLHVLRADVEHHALVVATYRDTDLDRSHPLSTVLADLRRLPGASRLPLGGLDESGLASLLTDAGGHDLDDAGLEFASELGRETDGNPFFVGEVLRHLTESGALVQEDGRWRAGTDLDGTGLPEGIREVIGRRLAVLPQTTNDLLGAASVLGREFDVELLASSLEMPLDTAYEALDPAERARLIAEVPAWPGRYSFSHALVRTTLSEELGTNRRVRLHRAAGLALEALSEPPVARLAHHFGEAAVMGESDRAVRYQRAAAEQALVDAASDDAVAYIRRALEIAELADVPPSVRADLWLLLGRALDLSGASADGRDATARAFELAVEVGQTDTACEAALEYGGLLGVWNSYGDQRGPAQLRTALDLADPSDPALLAALTRRLATWLATAAGDAGTDVARSAVALADRVGTASLRAGAAVTLASHLRNVDPIGQLAAADEALAAGAGRSGRRPALRAPHGRRGTLGARRSGSVRRQCGCVPRVAGAGPAARTRALPGPTRAGPRSPPAHPRR